MADCSPTSGGKKKQHGNLNPEVQKQRDRDVQVIIANWKISDLDEAFPTNIKPKSLGTSAISNIKYISRRCNLAEAQALFLKECKDSNGAYIPLSYAHTGKLLKALREAEATNPKEANSSTNGAANKSTTQNFQKSAVETPKSTTSSGITKGSGDLVVTSSSIQPPFGHSSSPVKKVDENQLSRSIPHTRGVAIPKKKPQASGEASSSNSGKTLANKKRPVACKTGDGCQHQESRVTKKTRCETELTLPEVITDTLAPSIGVPSITNHQSDDDLLAALDRIMETNRKENEKLFNASIPKLAPVTADTAENTIIVVAARQDRCQSLGPLQAPKVKRSRSASPPKTKPRKAFAEDPARMAQALSDINNDSDIELPAPKPIVRNADKQATKSSKEVNLPPPARISAFQAPTAQMGSLATKSKESTTILAYAIAAAAGKGALLQECGLREHCKNIQEILRDFMNQGLVKLARPDQQALVADLRAVFANTMRHLEADIDWVFKNDGSGSGGT